MSTNGKSKENNVINRAKDLGTFSFPIFICFVEVDKDGRLLRILRGRFDRE